MQSFFHPFRFLFRYCALNYVFLRISKAFSSIFDTFSRRKTYEKEEREKTESWKKYSTWKLYNNWCKHQSLMYLYSNVSNPGVNNLIFVSIWFPMWRLWTFHRKLSIVLKNHLHFLSLSKNTNLFIESAKNDLCFTCSKTKFGPPEIWPELKQS